MSKVGDVTAMIVGAGSLIIAGIWVRNLIHDRGKIRMDCIVQAKIEKHFQKCVEFTVTVRNSGRRPAAITRVLVKGDASWFPNSAENPFRNGDFSLFPDNSQNEQLVLAETESKTFTRSFRSNGWNDRVRDIKAEVRTANGKIKSAVFKLIREIG